MQVPPELWPVVCRLATSREWPPRGDVEIAAFFDFADRQNLVPLLMADVDLPPQVVAAKSRYRALDAFYRKRYELSRAGALELQRILGADAFLFLKGTDYRHRLYARPELRPMNDIDVYIPAVNVPAALAVLARAGYPRKVGGYGARLTPGFYEVPLEIKGVTVEIHHAFIQPVRNGIDYDSMWGRREWFERDGVGGFRLMSADAILGHAVSLAVDEFSAQLNRYVDFYLLLQSYGDLLPECVARAKAWGIERPLYGALQLTSALFPSARTPGVKDAIELLLDTSTRRFLVDRVLPDPTTERSGHVTGRYAQLWRKWCLIDRIWRRFAFFAYHVYTTAIGLMIEWKGRRSGLIDPKWPRKTGAAAKSR